MPLIGAVGAISLGAAAMYLSSGGSGAGALKIEPKIDLSDQTVVVPVSFFSFSWVWCLRKSVKRFRTYILNMSRDKQVESSNWFPF